MSPYSNAFRQDLRVLLKVIGCVVGYLVLLYCMCAPRGVHGPSDRGKCITNLSQIGFAMMVCSQDNGGVLPGQTWCDDVLRSGLKAKTLRCPASDADEGQCSYALNAAAIGKRLDALPSDMVLLFESKPGWNQVGGPELLTADSHEGDGCGVFFADGHAEFVRADRVANLRWDANEPSPLDVD